MTTFLGFMVRCRLFSLLAAGNFCLIFMAAVMVAGAAVSFVGHDLQCRIRAIESYYFATSSVAWLAARCAPR